MSWPANTMRPESGVIFPAIWPISVDLPAPLGPINAWISPGRRSSETSRVASSAPKRLCRPSSLSTASLIAFPPRQPAHHAVLGEQHQEQLPVLGQPAQQGLHHDEQNGPG